MAANLDGVRETVEALHAVDPTVPVLIGGQGAKDASARSILHRFTFSTLPNGNGPVSAR
jgi:hypothetical protein